MNITLLMLINTCTMHADHWSDQFRLSSSAAKRTYLPALAAELNVEPRRLPVPVLHMCGMRILEIESKKWCEYANQYAHILPTAKINCRLIRKKTLWLIHQFSVWVCIVSIASGIDKDCVNHHIFSLTLQSFRSHLNAIFVVKNVRWEHGTMNWSGQHIYRRHSSIVHSSASCSQTEISNKKKKRHDSEATSWPTKDEAIKHTQTRRKKHVEWTINCSYGKNISLIHFMSSGLTTAIRQELISLSIYISLSRIFENISHLGWARQMRANQQTKGQFI